MKIAYKVPVLESERGWGQKIDDYMICLTREIAKSFIEDFNSKNTADPVPDWYMKALDDISTIEISDAQLEYLKSNESKVSWWANLKQVK